VGNFLTAHRISYTYPGGSLPAISGVDLSIRRGEYVAIAGANGSGKTTMALILAGILRPEEGRLVVDETPQDPARDTPRVTMVFQNPEDQLVASAVEDDVAFGPENLGLPPAEIRRRVDEALLTVGLQELSDRDVHELSVGQQQLLAVAGALALKPDCLVLDEATAMLDPGASRRLLEVLDTLHAAGVTIVAVTHRMEEIARATRVIVVADGGIAVDTSPEQLFGDTRLERWGLRLPPVRLLGSSFAGSLGGFRADANTVQELAERLLRYAS
jgi:energy-coupling factor transport system ATP-binding protein